MKINHNIPAMNTYKILKMNTNSMQKVLEKLSSGKRINRAADDAAGMAISEKMRSQVKGLRQASRNSLDGISLIQTGEGALNEIHSMLQRMRELCVQGANGVCEDEDLEAIRDEIEQLTEQTGKIAEETQFNGINLLNGDKDKLILQVGADKGQIVEVNMSEMDATTSGLEIDNVPLDKNEEFGDAIKTYGQAIKKVSTMRSQLGAYQNRLEHTIRNLDNTSENLTASMSRIEDADMALEMSEFTKANVLQQAGTAMLAQANQLPQGVLQLLR